VKPDMLIDRKYTYKSRMKFDSKLAISKAVRLRQLELEADRYKSGQSVWIKVTNNYL
jgi:hypothetical protein